MEACCPIWAKYMSLLDARQGQPRDQARFQHLIGAPSPLGYLVGPAPEQAGRLSAGERNQQPGQPSQMEPRRPARDGAGSGELCAGTRRRHYRRSSDESMEQKRPGAKCEHSLCGAEIHFEWDERAADRTSGAGAAEQTTGLVCINFFLSLWLAPKLGQTDRRVELCQGPI